MARQQQSILFRPAGELFFSLPDAWRKTQPKSIHSAMLSRRVTRCSARFAPLLEVRVGHTTIFHSADGPKKPLSRGPARGPAAFCAGDRFYAESALQEITSTQWQKN
jgi:hypothetical protein